MRSSTFRDVGTSEKVRGPAKFRYRFKWTSTTWGICFYTYLNSSHSGEPCDTIKFINFANPKILSQNLDKKGRGHGPQPQCFLRLCRPSLTWCDLFKFLCFQVKIDALISNHINFTLACVEMRSCNHQVIRGHWHHLTSKSNFLFPISCWSHRKCQLSWHRVQKAAHLMCQTYITKCGRWSKQDCFSVLMYFFNIFIMFAILTIFSQKSTNVWQRQICIRLELQRCS